FANRATYGSRLRFRKLRPAGGADEIGRRHCGLTRGRTARAALLPQLLEQLDLDLLNLEQPVVLPAQEVIDLLVQMPNLELRFQVHLVIILGPRPISRFRPILAHHDDWRLQGCEAGEDQVHENERIRIKRAGREYDGVDDDPDKE